jgi:hypothetical protein
MKRIRPQKLKRNRSVVEEEVVEGVDRRGNPTVMLQDAGIEEPSPRKSKKNRRRSPTPVRLRPSSVRKPRKTKVC